MNRLGYLVLMSLLAGCQHAAKNKQALQEDVVCYKSHGSLNWQCANGEIRDEKGRVVRAAIKQPPERVQIVDSKEIVTTTLTRKNAVQETKPSVSVTSTSASSIKPATSPRTIEEPARVAVVATEPAVNVEEKLVSAPPPKRLLENSKVARSQEVRKRGDYTLQVYAASQRSVAENYAKQHKLQGYECVKVRSQDRIVYVILLGNYQDMVSAKTALQHLPAAIKQGRPWVRRVSNVQLAVQQAGS